MSKPKFVYVTYIAAPPEKVWEALTKPDIARIIGSAIVWPPTASRAIYDGNKSGGRTFEP